MIQLSPGIWLELICISSQGLIRIRVIGMVAGGRRQKACVWSLLNNPGHCPAPPKAAHSITFPCPHPGRYPPPLSCHQPGPRSQVPVTEKEPYSRMKLRSAIGKATCPFSRSLPASLRKKQPSKSVCLVSGYMYKKKGGMAHAKHRTFFSKFNLWRMEGTLLLVVTPSSTPSRLGKQVTLHLGHFPPTHPNPVYVPS